MHHRPNAPALLTVACCCLGVLGLGYVTFGERVFAFRLVSAQFVGLGPLAGVFVAAAPRLSPRSLVALAFAAWAVVAAADGSRTPALLLRDAAWVGTVAAGAVVCAAGRRGLPRALPARLIVQLVAWAGVMAVAQLAAVAVVATVRGLVLPAEAARTMAMIGALAGAGAALGDTLAERVATAWRRAGEPRNANR